MIRMLMKIYLAHSLTQAPEEFKAQMLRLWQALKAEHEVLEYFGLEGGAPADVFKHDTGCVANCDLLLAEVTYPAIGLGFEIAAALNLGKKVLAVAKPDAKISRLILGINSPGYQFKNYSTVEDVAAMVAELKI